MKRSFITKHAKADDFSLKTSKKVILGDMVLKFQKIYENEKLNKSENTKK